MTLVEWIIIVVFVLVLGTTIVAASNGRETVSNTLQRWAYMHSWFAFTMGALMGHWFIPTKWLGLPGVHTWPWLLLPMGLLGIFDGLHNLKVVEQPYWLRWPLIYVLLGMPAGAMLWQS